MNHSLEKLDTIENIVDYTIDNNITMDQLRKKILKNEKINTPHSFIENIEKAKSRINSQLNTELKFYYFLFPFGLINSFSNTKDENLVHFQKNRYIKKINQRIFFSLLGIINYLLITIFIIYFTKK